LPRVNYREVLERFSRIDGRFIACEIGFPEKDGFFTVEFYPWWEHPLYLKTQSVGTAWEITTSPETYQAVTVYPQRVYEFRISRDDEVEEWDFTQEHPLLWQYEKSQQITVNSSLSLEQWMQIRQEAQAKLIGYCRDANLEEWAFLDNVYRWGQSGSFTLGPFPRPLFLAMREVLDERAVSYFALNEPGPVKLPILFLIDGSDYIIADDFELDVPEFEHKPEWFQQG
jgi:hypothetical protein